MGEGLQAAGPDAYKHAGDTPCDHAAAAAAAAHAGAGGAGAEAAGFQFRRNFVLCWVHRRCEALATH